VIEPEEFEPLRVKVKGDPVDHPDFPISCPESFFVGIVTRRQRFSALFLEVPMSGLFSSFKHFLPFRRQGGVVETKETICSFNHKGRSKVDPSLETGSVTHFRSYPLPVRILAAALSALLFLTSSPPLLAITMSQIKAGSATPGAGGQGSFSNLQNAGAASAALTAAMAQGNIKKANDIIAAMKQAQVDARKNVSAASIPNGLRPGGLEVYNPSGQVTAGNTPVTWSGISSLAETRSGPSDASSAIVNIKQSSQNSYLYWNKFNVGQQTTLNFDQSAGGQSVSQWIAFNKVMSASDPSHIFGNITAQGQVYILNQNGILFHNGSAVNTRSLVASTLPINPGLSGVPNGTVTAPLSASGLMNNPKYQFLFSAVKNGNADPFTPDPAPVSGIGNVVVERGATISAPVDNNNSGGLVALIGPGVRNEGTIETPNGQTILAAGLQVILSPHSSADPSLRGLDVAVGKVSDNSVPLRDALTLAGGTALNAGMISAPLGSVAIVGKTVLQNGVIDSGTSVALNGRIDLMAAYNAVPNPAYAPDGPKVDPVIQNSMGLVEVGSFVVDGKTYGGLLDIIPQYDSKDTVIGTTLPISSSISLLGKSVHLSTESELLAPGAIATTYQDGTHALSLFGRDLSSGVAIDAGSWSFQNGRNVMLHDSGQIYVDDRAVIDVSGSTGVKVDSAQNYLTLQLRGAELANSPLQRTSAIRGKDITVDIRNTGSYDGQYWVGTPLGDVTGFVGLIQRGVGQLTVNGGSVSLAAGDSVVLRQGAEINVSGGWVQYTGGTFSTTKLLSSTGQIVDISKTTPDQIYTQVVKASASYYEAPYVSGGNGGSLSIQSPALALDGSLDGLTVVGARQLRTTPSSGVSALPTSSALALKIGRELTLTKGGIALVSPYSPNVTFSRMDSSLLAVPDSFSTEQSFSLPTARNNELFLDPALLSSHGFGNLSLDNHDGSIAIPQGTLLDAGAGGNIIFKASAVSIEGGISAPGGAVSISAYRVSSELMRAMSETGLTRGTDPWTEALVLNGESVLQYGNADSSGKISVLHEDGTYGKVSFSSTIVSGSGGVTLGTKATITTAGLVVNGINPITDPISISGGGISVSGYNVSLQKGSLLDVSGGALLLSSGNTIYGDAGKLSISGGSDIQVADLHHGQLGLGSSLYGFAGLQPGGTGGKPGTLELTAPAIELGGETSGRKLGLNAAFFNQGGFGTFNLTGVGMEIPGSTSFVPGISVATGATIRPSIESYRLIWKGTTPVLSINSRYGSFGFAPSITLKSTGLKDDGLSDGSKYLIRGDVVMGERSSVFLDPGLILLGGIPTASAGALTIRGNTVDIEGNLTVAGGSIVISDKLDDSGVAVGFNPNQTKPLVPYATVVVGSTAKISTDGEVLYTPDPKGIRARFGTVLPGGSITIGGNLLVGSATIEASGSSAVLDDFRFSSYTVDSAGGLITLSGRQFLYSDATLVASTGGSTSIGGGLVLQSGRFYNEDETQYPSELNLSVSQSGRWTGGMPSSGSLVGFSPEATGGIPEGGGHVSVSSFSGGGFNSLTLGGKVLFSGGDISISLPGNLIAATQGVLQSSGQVQLSASHISLGIPFAHPLQDGDPNKISVFTSSLSSDNNLNYVTPSWGGGRISASASLIDLGNLALRNIGTADLEAGGGAIRGDGTFAMAGDLTLAAREVYPVSGVTFEAVAFGYDSLGRATSSSTGIPGSIRVLNPSGLSPSLPLSAGGTMEFFASSIQQQGNLLAPFGRITLGASSAGTKDPVSGISAPLADSVILSEGSITSVSGSGLVVPFGTSADGTSWVDVSGTDITASGIPGKSIVIAGTSVTTAPNSTLDLAGGGTIDAFRWISGLGGTINLLGSPSGSWSSGASYSSGDLVIYNGSTWSARVSNGGKTPVVGPYWSKVAQAFAIIPGYDANFAPTGYTDGSIKVGDSVFINSGADLASGSYTLLPASYANLPGAYLVSVNSTLRDTRVPISYTKPDGSVVVSGTIYNDVTGNNTAAKDSGLLTIYKSSVLASRVQYGILNADEFFKQIGSPKPQDAGNAVIASRGKLVVNGKILGGGTSGGVSAAIDLSAPGSFVIGGNEGDVQLNPGLIGSWIYGSLLLGGLRGSVDSSGATPVAVSADSIVLAAGVSLKTSDIILAAMKGIQLGDHSEIISGGTCIAPNENLTISGNGGMIRVSDDSQVSISRTLMTSSGASSGVSLSIGDNVILTGASVMLDSSASMQVNPSVALNASSITLNAGSIALVLNSDRPSGPLVLAGATLDGLAKAKNLNITSYSTFDIYGAGSFGSDAMESLVFHAGEIRGFDLGGGTAAFAAQTIKLDNSSDSSSPGPVTVSTDGYLELNAATIMVGKNALAIDQFSGVSLNATGVIAGTSSGSLRVGTSAMPADLYLTAPLITASKGNSLNITASGDLILQSPDPGYATTPSIQAGAGVTLSFTGAMVSADTTLSAPSGSISLHATSGDVNVGGSGTALLDVSGVSKMIQSATVTADAGTISLQSDAGNVNLSATASMDLSASASSSAGTLNITAPAGVLTIDPGTKLNAAGGASGGANGSFSLDVASLDPSGQGPSLLSTIIPQLSPDENGNGGFTKSVSFRIRTGDVDVDTYIKAAYFSLTADQGTIDVTPKGVIDASGSKGGTISLQASGSVILEPNSSLNVHGENYDNAGKGGEVYLSAGAAVERVSEVDGSTYFDINRGASLDLQTASSIDLGVTADATHQLGGTLHLRVPITADNSDIQISSFDATISGASSISVEGYRFYDLTGTSGVLTEPLRDQINKDAAMFFGQPRSDATPSTTILQRLIVNQDPRTSDIINLMPGVEIINASGNLSLLSDWDLSVLRYGEGLSFADSSGSTHTIGKDPGFLVLRASGDIVLAGSISDGFGDSINPAVSTTDPNNSSANLCYKTLVPVVQDASGQNVSQKSWSYSITTGADLSSANLLATSFSGSLKLGKPTDKSNLIAADDPSSTQLFMIQDFLSSYQVIRTGTGDISIAAGGDIQLLNQFATIYTAGSRVVDPTLSGKFDLPMATVSQFGLVDYTTILGMWQQPGQIEAQFSSGGGNISMQAGGNIAHLQLMTKQFDQNGKTLQDPYSSDPTLTADSSRQLPENWLMRRGNTDANGNWKLLTLTDQNGASYNEVTTTAWWVDFANFFEGVGTLGGGNVSMTAVGSVMNVDVSTPTQARMTARSDQGVLQRPDQGMLVETGGGDITIKTGKNLDAGVYYAERGDMGIRVSGDIVSNKTRDVKGDYLYFLSDTGNRSASANPSSGTYLPTSFLLGQGNISVVSGGSALLGPVGNAFMLTQGIDNDVSYKTYFSTYDLNPELGAPAVFQALSLSGDLTLRSTINGSSAFTAWMLSGAVSPARSAGNVQPWIRIADASATGIGLMPASVSLEAISGNIALQGSLSLVPSAFGNISLLSAGSIAGLSPQGSDGRWISATVNLSDASPAVMPSVTTPLYSASGFDSDQSLMSSLGSSFAESGSFSGYRASIQSKQQLHGISLLHSGDTQPVEIYAGLDITGVTLYSPKAARITAGGDITDVGLYIQNTSAADVSNVTAGGSIVLFDHTTDLEKKAYDFNRSFAITVEQKKALQTFWPWAGSGDIQISGPGALVVTAGGNIDLGNGANNADGTGVGITSIGNARNPHLPFDGADIQLMAGVGSPQTLGSDKILSSAAASADGSRYFKEVGDALGQMGDNGLLDSYSTARSWNDLISSGNVSDEQKSRIAAVLFDIILRDAGRDHNNPTRFTDSLLSGSDGKNFLSLIKNNLEIFGLPSDFVVTRESVSAASAMLSQSQKASLGQVLYSLVLKEKGKKYVDQYANGYQSYQSGEDAISNLFGSGDNGTGSVITWSRDLRTKNGGSITINAPGGGVTLANTTIGSTLAPPGIVTEHGGSINIFTKDNVDIGIGRIFTLRGGDIMIWSDKGNIAAGSSAKTVASAPPTRVLIDPQSAAVLTDLAGLATGGGIGVLATVKDAPVGNVDLIAVTGIIDAGDAGIRSSGNLNLSATKILNADNIVVAGVSVGAPASSAPASAAAPAAPPAAAPPAAANTAAAANNSAAETASKNNASGQSDETPSIYSIDILGYGGGEEDEDKKKAADAAVAPIQASL
jgi:filamentous hemagglutinin